jgi:hypothetical protein
LTDFAANPAVPSPILCLNASLRQALAALIGRYGMTLREHPVTAPLPGSYWGAPEAGLQGHRLHINPDTPLHSALHEACHYLCMDPQRRACLDTDAGGDDLEECAVCFLQILLADELPGVGRERLMEDMDAWGYSFRLGSARDWFYRDAGDARAWLEAHGLIDDANRPTWALRHDDTPRGTAHRPPRTTTATHSTRNRKP